MYAGMRGLTWREDRAREEDRREEEEEEDQSAESGGLIAVGVFRVGDLFFLPS